MTIIDDTSRQPRNEPSLFVQTGVFAGLTAIAIAIGWLAGLYLSGNQPATPRQQAAKETLKASETTLAEADSRLGIVHLDPITTNLAGPTDIWVRLELALIFDGKPDLIMAQNVQQDILAYLRTVKFHQVEGASGFQHLRSDIEERAAIRSEGKIKGVLIRTLLFE